MGRGEAPLDRRYATDLIVHSEYQRGAVLQYYRHKHSCRRLCSPSNHILSLGRWGFGVISQRRITGPSSPNPASSSTRASGIKAIDQVPHRRPQFCKFLIDLLGGSADFPLRGRGLLRPHRGTFLPTFAAATMLGAKSNAEHAPPRAAPRGPAAGRCPVPPITAHAPQPAPNSFRRPSTLSLSSMRTDQPRPPPRLNCVCDQ